MYSWDLVSLIEAMYGGDKSAREKMNDILLYRCSYGDFTTPDNLMEAVDMLRKCESALSLAKVSTPFRNLFAESIKSSYARLEIYFRKVCEDVA